MELDSQLMKKVKIQVLRGLRGPLSQLEMSHKLGFTFNQWSKWETEQKALKWDEFVEALSKLDISIEKILKDVFAMNAPHGDFYIILDYFTAGMKSAEIENLLQIDEMTLKRWRRDQVSPTIELVFNLIAARQNALSLFLSAILPIDKVEILLKDFKKTQIHQKHQVLYPMSGAVEACLELKEYQQLSTHDDLWISQRIQMPVDLVQSIFAHLKAIGAIELKGQKFVRVSGWVPMTAMTPVDAAKVDGFWTRHAGERYETSNGVPLIPARPVNANLRSFRVAAVSEETALKIQQKLRQTSQEILSMIVEDKGEKDLVVLYLSHFYDVGDVKGLSDQKKSEKPVEKDLVL